MRRQQKLLLSCMVGGLMLFYGIAALTSPEIAKTALGSTVHLGIFDAQVNLLARGSGFFVGPNQIATNYHVIEAILNEGAIGGAKLVGKEEIYAIEKIVAHSKNHDLAIVKVKGVKIIGINVPALPLGDSDAVQIGDKVYVAGNPEGLEGTFSDGIISAIRGNSTDKIFQMTAPISPGSSGGPVLNDSGKVIGISVGGMEHGQNLNFAIPVNYLKPLVKMPIGPPIVNNDSPSKISVGEIIPLTLNLISTKNPQQVTIHYKTYDKDRNELEPNNQKMRLRNQQSTSSTWVYKVDLPSQKHVGSIEYYIAVEYDNHLVFRYPRSKNRHYQISIVDEKPPTISLLYPPEGAKFGTNQEITIRAEVTDNIAVKDVHIHTSSFNNQQSQKLTAEGSSDIYTINITLRNIVTLRYYLTATDDEGNESRSEPRHLEMKITTQENLEKGIKLYEQARYNEAIEALSSAVRELEDPEQRAEAYLYLGGAKRGFGESNEKVKEQFQEAIRHNPGQKLPPRIGQDHPIFAELLEEVRKELTGELTVISLLPQTEIWIFGTGTDRKRLGTGIVSSRLLKGNYIVEGSYAGESSRKTVAIEPDRHTELNLEIPPDIKHDSPSRISVGEIIPLTLNLISTKNPQQVTVHYKTYDKDGNELEPNNQKRRLWNQQSTLSTWIYKVDLPSQSHVGSIEYYIAVEYDNHLVFKYPRTQSRYYQISIVDDEPPTISLLDSPEVGNFDAHQKITIRAEVTDNIAVKDVHIHSSWFNSQKSQKLAADDSSDIYTIDITVSNIVVLRYHLTAADEAGNESRYPETGKLKITVTPDDETPPTIRLIKSYDGAPFKVNQRITIEAKVTDDTSVEQVRLFYSFSLSSHLFEPSHYSDRSLIETSLGTYTGHIPPQSKAGYIWYYLTATDGRNESKSEVRRLEIKTIPPLPPPTIYQGIWASVAANDASTSDRDGGNMFRLAYLREGKTHPTLGGQLNFSYPDRTNVSAMVQWGPPALGNTNIAFTLLGGIAEYENFLATGTAARSTHMTPILGAGLKFYPRDKIVIDATSSIKFRSDYDTTGLYHYEIGARFYITREVNLKIGYGKLYLGNRNFTTIQVGLGYTF